MKRALLGLLLVSLLEPAAAQSAGNTSSVRLQAGSLSLSSSGSLQFPAVTLNGFAQTVNANASPTFTIIDPRGSGVGWHMNLRCGNFSSGLNTISATNLTYVAADGVITVLYGQSVGTGGPAETGVSGNLSTARQVLTANANAGMGNYRWVPAPSRFALQLPAETHAGIYTAVLTVSLVTGP